VASVGLAIGLAGPAGAAVVPSTPVAAAADFGQLKPPADVRSVADWALRSGDRGTQGYAVLDKKDARLYVFGADGRLQARTAVLLGLARGDTSVPGIGERPLKDVRPEERTTPAGRFELEAGRNMQGEDILWVDYGAAVSMHRLRATDPRERRQQRLASPTSADNRISFGCINVPPGFFNTVLSPAFAHTPRTRRGILYILPEVKPLAEVFPGVAGP
jgi:hypothetical protein